MPVQKKELQLTPVFESQVPFYTSSMHTLVIHCSQHNYQEPIDDFMRTHLRRESYDRLAVPGGPQFFLSSGYMPKFEWAGKKWTEFLVTNHHITELILIGHDACAWNSAVANQKDPSQLQRYTCQSLLTMRDLALRVPSPFVVRTFFAQPNAHNHVEFLSVQ